MGNSLKALVATSAVAVLLPVAAGDAKSTATATYSCKQVWSSFNIQLVGDRDWGWNLGALGSVGAPRKKAIIVVWSLGGHRAQQGQNFYSWTTSTRSRSSDRCRTVKQSPKEPTLAGLGPATKVKDGWAFGRKFGCLDSGSLLITTTQGSGKARVVVRMQASGKVMAVGELANGGGWIRGAKTCEAKEK
jgi:hypothetical protein